MFTDVALLINPSSGGGHAAHAAQVVTRVLRQAGISVDELVGRDEAQTRDLARQAVERGTGALVACGGDGVTHIALQSVVGTQTPFGVIPAGTGNDCARMLGIPRGDAEAAAGVILNGQVRAIDVGKGVDVAGDQWFGTVLAGGFDAKVNDRTNRMRWPRGAWRYNLATLAELAALRPLPYVIEMDDRRLEIEASTVAVGNGQSYGAGMRICPSAVIDDGLFDITVIGPGSRTRLIRLFHTVYSGTHVNQDKVTTYRAKRVSVSTHGITAYADGEPFAPLPLTVECVPGAVNAIVSPKDAALSVME